MNIAIVETKQESKNLDLNEIDKITYWQNIWMLGKWNIFLRVTKFQSCAVYS